MLWSLVVVDTPDSLRPARPRECQSISSVLDPGMAPMLNDPPGEDQAAATQGTMDAQPQVWQVCLSIVRTNDADIVKPLI